MLKAAQGVEYFTDCTSYFVPDGRGSAASFRPADSALLQSTMYVKTIVAETGGPHGGGGTRAAQGGQIKAHATPYIMVS
jgi:hypothetical protein